ncbi:hypothetical protein QTP88_028432 [Uroleucon formosanum]
MQGDWSNATTIKFLELYEAESAIWDAKDKNHKSKHKVHDAWKRISLDMNNIPIEELKAKKKSLMATFRPLLKKKKASIRSGAGTDDVFQPIWFAYDIMERFLGTNFEVVETINTEDEMSENIYILTFESEILMPPSSTSSIQSSDEISAPSPSQENTMKTNTPTCRTNDAQKKINESFDTLNHVLKKKKEDEDECKVYAKLLAKKLRKYPERMRDQLMYKIDGFLLDNPYPDEQPSSAYSYYSSTPSPHYQNSTPSPASDVSHINMLEGKESQHTPVELIQSHNGLKRAHHVENSNEAVNAKKIRMNIVNTRGFVKTGTSLSNIINWYYMKNIDNLTNYSSFLETSKRDLIQLLKSLSVKHPIKYNLKLEATYDRPNVENSSENRAFKTSAKEMFMDTDIETNIDMDFANLLSEEDVYTSKGSGFTLQSIDGLLLGVYKYTPMGGSSYIPLPNEIKNKKSSQKTEHKESIIFCKRCFSSFDNQPLKNTLYGQAALDQHQLICGAYKPILPQMPDAGTILEFDGWSKTQHHPIVIYADFEALLVKCKESKGKNTSAFQKHEPMSYGVFIKATENIPLDLLEKFDLPQQPIIFRGDESHQDVAKRFVNEVTEIARKFEHLLKTNIPIIMTEEEQRKHTMQNTCNLCKCIFSDKNHKVADHCHLSGQFRQTLCNTCNLKLQKPNFVSCILHNLSNYDAHFIVTELGNDAHSTTVIPNSEEKFISFSKHVSNNFSIRFIDSCRFMASKLSTLADNLISPEFEKFRETAKVFNKIDMPLVTRKGVYPYEYTDSWDKLEESSLPKKADFYSTLTEEHIDDEEYEHAVSVWNHFKCKTLGEYSDLYLKIDVLLLADVFENFRDMCISTYNLDPVFYYTAPGFSFDCMLKYTNVKLELLSDYDTHLFIENSIRGGLTQASIRYAKANNEKTIDYDPTKPKSWIVYQDCNNLYGWAMSQYMPYGDFKWVEPKLDGLDALTPTSDIGRVYEVDISYPNELHDSHNDLPFLPENKIPPGSKVKKLMATLHSKKNYVIHYRNLQQAIANGLIVENVHRVLEFRQSAWLAKYIQLNTEMRKKAVNEFEKDFSNS